MLKLTEASLLPSWKQPLSLSYTWPGAASLKVSNVFDYFQAGDRQSAAFIESWDDNVYFPN